MSNYNSGLYNASIGYNTVYVPPGLLPISASNLDLYIDQGSEYQKDFTLRDELGVALNLSDYTVEASIRKYYSSNETYLMQAAIVAPLEGKIRLIVPSTETLKLRHPRYVYEVRLTDGPLKYKVFFGQILVSRMA